jgi:hypothetical protein
MSGFLRGVLVAWAKSFGAKCCTERPNNAKSRGIPMQIKHGGKNARRWGGFNWR